MGHLAGPEICVIAACEETTRVMGRDNQLIWKLPSDMKRFAALTREQVVIMGRKTYESIGKKPLPDRTNIVVSSREDFYVPGGAVIKSPIRALSLARGVPTKRICFIGGVRIFEEALEIADTLYLTLVSDPKAKGDVYFPPYGDFRAITGEETYEEKGFRFRFLTLKRKTAVI